MRRPDRGRARRRAHLDGPPCRGLGAVLMDAIFVACVILLVLAAAMAAASVRVLREYERAVVFRLGRLLGQRGPGLVLLIPGIDRMVRVTCGRSRSTIPPQDVITRDNVTARVDAVAYFRVVDAAPRSCHVEDARRDAADRADDAALRARQGRPRHAAVRARAAQRGPAADHRRADRAVGHQGHDGRDQGRRASPRRCSRRWRARPRPSASGGRRSSTRRPSSRPRRSWRRRRR